MSAHPVAAANEERTCDSDVAQGVASWACHLPHLSEEESHGHTLPFVGAEQRQHVVLHIFGVCSNSLPVLCASSKSKIRTTCHISTRALVSGAALTEGGRSSIRVLYEQPQTAYQYCFTVPAPFFTSHTAVLTKDSIKAEVVRLVYRLRVQQQGHGSICEIAEEQQLRANPTVRCYVYCRGLAVAPQRRGQQRGLQTKYSRAKGPSSFSERLLSASDMVLLLLRLRRAALVEEKSITVLLAADKLLKLRAAGKKLLYFGKCWRPYCMAGFLFCGMIRQS